MIITYGGKRKTLIEDQMNLPWQIEVHYDQLIACGLQFVLEGTIVAYDADGHRWKLEHLENYTE